MNPWNGISKDLLRLSGLPLKALMDQALEVKLEHRADRFSLCTIMNVKSGQCSEDCAFCAQSSRFKTNSPVYALKSTDEIINEAKKAKAAGAQRFSLVASGRGPNDDNMELYAERISAIRNSAGINVCASLGIIGKDALARLKEAGLSRYHHNLETSAGFYPKIVTTHSFEERVNTIMAARQAGLEVCAGGIVGLGETREDRIDMAAALKYLNVDSVPLNILVPIQGTPLASTQPMPIDEILRAIAILRIALPDKAIRIAGGRESALKDFQTLAFLAGADAMLIGGYLTVRGRAVEEDRSFAEKIRGLWRKMLPA